MYKNTENSTNNIKKQQKYEYQQFLFPLKNFKKKNFYALIKQCKRINKLIPIFYVKEDYYFITKKNNYYNQITQSYYNLLTMDNQFGRKIKRTRGRSRFYSSMNYDEYVDYFGVPDTPHFKPLLDPEDIPELILQSTTDQSKIDERRSGQTGTSGYRLEPIPQIQGSENLTNNQFCSPRKTFGLQSDLIDIGPKRSYSRMRSQSQNSQYLIFNFLERMTKKPSKKVKCQ